MANKTILDYQVNTSIDSINDYILIYQNSTADYRKASRNTFLGFTGTPADISSTQSITNKTLDNTNTITLKDTLFTLQDDGNITRQAKFQLSGITAGQTRTYTLPDASSTLVDLASAQTLSGVKTLTAPIINAGTINNPTTKIDTIIGYTSTTTGSIYGVAVTSGVIQTANTVDGAAIKALSIATSAYADNSVTAGKIEIQESWHAPTLLNSWVNYDSGFSDTGYMKDSLGFVQIRGTIKSGTTNLGTRIFDLPAGYRPEGSMYLPTVNGGGNVFGVIEITSGGGVNIIVGNASYMMFGCITYKAYS